jgi:hypothetical protein
VATARTVKALPGRYAKFLTAVAGNALVYADITYGATNRWVELATAAAVALGVLAVPNTNRPLMLVGERGPEMVPAPAAPGGYPAGGTPVSELPPPPSATQAPPAAGGM